MIKTILAVILGLLVACNSSFAYDRELEINGKTYVTDGNGLWNMSGQRVDTSSWSD